MNVLPIIGGDVSAKRGPMGFWDYPGRGISTPSDAWMKELAPSTELRKWFKREEPEWVEFKQRYLEELDQNSDAIDKLRQTIEKGRVTLLYSAQDKERNHAVALKEFLAGQDG